MMSDKLVSRGLNKLVERMPADVIEITLASEQASALATVRNGARRIILAKWPIEKQMNAALGLLPPAATDQCKADIQSVREASNAAELAIQNAGAANGKALKADERASIRGMASVNWPEL